MMDCSLPEYAPSVFAARNLHSSAQIRRLSQHPPQVLSSAVSAEDIPSMSASDMVSFSCAAAAKARRDHEL